VLLFPTLWVRVAEYGWTPVRYIALIAGIWVAGVLVIALAARGGDEDMRVVSGLLAVLLGAAAFGPWGVADVAARSQYERLEALLTAKGLLANGRWRGTDRPIPWDAVPAIPHTEPGQIVIIGPKDRITAQSAIDTLSATGQIDRLRPWFEGQPNNPFDNPARGRAVDLIQQKMELRFALPPETPGSRIFFSVSNPTVMALPGAGTLLGPLGVTSLATRQAFDAPGATGGIVMDGKQIHVEVGNARIASFDLSGTLQSLRAQSLAVAGDAQSPHRPAIMVEGTAPGRARLAVTFLSGSFDDTHANIQVTAYLLLLAPQ
jgi:Domain of unknown function (DUF4153)